MTNEEDIDLALIKEAKKGNTHAFDALVLKYQYKVFKLVSRYIKDPTEVLDVTQEAFIRAYNGLDKFREESRFYTWLYRIAINVAKNHLVEQGKKFSEININTDEIEEKISKKVQSEYLTPENILLNKEFNHIIRETIDTLPNDLKTAILLREVDGMTYNDIANIMGCPVGTIRSRIHRAREMITKKVGPLISSNNDF